MAKETGLERCGFQGLDFGTGLVDVQLALTIAQRVAHYLERQGLLVRDVEHSYLTAGQCQTKTTGSAHAAVRPSSGSKLTPLGEGGGAIKLEIFAAIEVALLVEVVVN